MDYKNAIKKSIEAAAVAKETKFKFLAVKPEEAEDRLVKYAEGMKEDYEKYM